MHSMYSVFRNDEREAAVDIARVAAGNPFEEPADRAETWPAAAFGDATTEPEVPGRPGVAALVRRAISIVEDVKARAADAAWTEADVDLHGELVRFVLYFEFRDRLQAAVDAGFANPDAVAVPWYDEFREAFRRWSATPRAGDPYADPAHVFAGFFQIRRAYHLIESQFVGTSRPLRALRAAAWESVFTTDVVQYGRWLYDRMQDVSTLVVGPSGTGKELVARAIGLSRYLPFDARRRRFREPFTGAFHAVNLSALAATLVESELFGHAKGAFTGAVEDREGWFETCRAGHAVFLDEIGELPGVLQVKLLRVLQERVFQRLGETSPRSFGGKVIAATNRDLDVEMEEGRFREDFYYRLCSDVIRTPALRAQLDDAPGDLDRLVAALVARQVGRPAPELVERTTAVIRSELPDHDWPGNVRELEQCVRSVLVRGRYHPRGRRLEGPREHFARQLLREVPIAEDLLDAYCHLLYEEHGTYAAVARLCGLDRRTVQRRVTAQRGKGGGSLGRTTE